MKLKSVILRLTAFAALASILTACDKSEETNEIRIGAILPLTGRYADAGSAIRVGFELAREDINAAQAGGKKFRVYFYDTKSEAKNALTGYNQLSTVYGIKTFFTTISENGMVLKPAVLRDGGRLYGILSHVDLLTNGNGHIYRMLQTGTDEAEFLCSYIESSGTSHKIVAYIFNAEAGKAFKNTFKSRLSDRILEIHEFGEDVESLKAMVASSRLKESDCVLAIGYSSALGTVAKLVRQSGFDGPIISNIGFNTPSVIAAAGDAAATVVFNDYDLPSGTPDCADKMERALKEYNTPFSSLSWIAYGALNLMDKAQTSQIDCSKRLDDSAGGVTFHIYEDGRVITGLKMSTLGQ